MNKICPKCKKKFEFGGNSPRGKLAIYCSHECKKREQDTIDGIPKGTVGAISELIVCSDLMKKGYTVFRAVSQCSFCDIVAIKDSKVIKVEVKTIRTGLKPASDSVKNKYVDIVAGYCKENNKIQYFNNKLKLINI